MMSKVQACQILGSDRNSDKVYKTLKPVFCSISQSLVKHHKHDKGAGFPSFTMFI